MWKQLWFDIFIGSNGRILCLTADDVNPTCAFHKQNHFSMKENISGTEQCNQFDVNTNRVNYNDRSVIILIAVTLLSSWSTETEWLFRQQFQPINMRKPLSGLITFPLTFDML